VKKKKRKENRTGSADYSTVATLLLLQSNSGLNATASSFFWVCYYCCTQCTERRGRTGGRQGGGEQFRALVVPRGIQL
jgi:hypothetical protein